MYFNENERTAIFIDGNNFSDTLRQLDMKVDYKRLLDFFRGRTRPSAPPITRVTWIWISSRCGRYSTGCSTTAITLLPSRYRKLKTAVVDRPAETRASTWRSMRLTLRTSSITSSCSRDMPRLGGPSKYSKRRGSGLPWSLRSRLIRRRCQMGRRRRADQMIDLVDLEPFITRERPRE